MISEGNAAFRMFGASHSHVLCWTAPGHPLAIFTALKQQKVWMIKAEESLCSQNYQILVFSDISSQ